MEACAENNITLIILDRPNPNGFYIDGPVLNLKYKSFVGLHPVPLVYGMTIGEYATMINGEKWLNDRITCNLKIILCKNYTHSSKYILPVKPSPNLIDMQAVYLYPSLALFEGTAISVGRGTDKPFKSFGHPSLLRGEYFFVPQKNHNKSKPLYCDTTCRGYDLSNFVFNDSNYFTIKWLIMAYQAFPDKRRFFNRFFYNLSGNDILIKQIEDGVDENEIRKTWKPEIEKFMKLREKYLLYP